MVPEADMLTRTCECLVRPSLVMPVINTPDFPRAEQTTKCRSRSPQYQQQVKKFFKQHSNPFQQPQEEANKSTQNGIPNNPPTPLPNPQAHPLRPPLRPRHHHPRQPLPQRRLVSPTRLRRRLPLLPSLQHRAVQHLPRHRIRHVLRHLRHLVPIQAARVRRHPRQSLLG